MPQTVSSAVISLGESNALIPIGGLPTIKRHILRCLSIGIKNIYIIGHFTPETLELLHSDPDIKKIHILNNQTANPWHRIVEDSPNEPLLFISSEHYTDIKTFQFTAEIKAQDNQVIFVGNPDNDQVAAARNRILLTPKGEPISIHERAKAEAVWMGLTCLGPGAINKLANKKGGMHFETLKQASILASSGDTFLQTVYSSFWERIDSNLMGNYATKEIQFLIEEIGFRPLQKLEYGFTEKLLNIVNFNVGLKNIFLNLSFLICFFGGMMIPGENLIKSFLALTICLFGIIMSVSANELKIMVSKEMAPGTDYSLLAKRSLILGVCTHYALETNPSVFVYIAIFITLVITILELKKEAFLFEMERPIFKYIGCKNWLKVFLKALSLDWVWYGLIITTIFNVNSYFCILISEIFIIYAIFLIQIPITNISKTSKKEKIINEKI